MKKRNTKQALPPSWLSQFTFLIFTLSLVHSCKMMVIDDNEKGVRFERFNGGLNPDVIYEPGLHIYPLWDRTTVYNIDTVTQEEQLYIKTADGHRYEIDLVLRYQLIPDRIGYLHDQIGSQYYERVIIRELEAAFKARLTEQNSALITADDIDNLQSNILTTTSHPIRKKYVELIALKIKDIAKLE